jgi:hypothetical protein
MIDRIRYLGVGKSGYAVAETMAMGAFGRRWSLAVGLRCWADDQHFAEEKHHGHHKQTAGSMPKTDRMVRQITSAGF